MDQVLPYPDCSDLPWTWELIQPIVLLTGTPRSFNLIFSADSFWSWSAKSTRRSSCSFFDSATSCWSLLFSSCKIATVLLDESKCCFSDSFSSERALTSLWQQEKSPSKLDHKHRNSWSLVSYKHIPYITCNSSNPMKCPVALLPHTSLPKLPLLPTRNKVGRCLNSEYLPPSPIGLSMSQ